MSRESMFVAGAVFCGYMLFNSIMELVRYTEHTPACYISLLSALICGLACGVGMWRSRRK